MGCGVSVETNCNIGSKRAFPTGLLESWHNCLLIYRRNVTQLPRPHRFVYFCVMTQQDVHSDRQRLPKIWVSTCLVCSVHPRGKTELILTVKMETSHPIEEPFGREFSAFVIIAELWWPEVAKPGNFVSNFCVFFGKTTTLKLSLLRESCPNNLPGPDPTFGSHCPWSHRNWFTFGGVIVEYVKTVFAR